jgi:hypothetical protein
MLKSIVLLILLWTPLNVLALDSASEEALKKTQELLKNRSAREEATQSGAARDADKYVKDLSGNSEQVSDNIYGLAADVFETLVKEISTQVPQPVNHR